MIENITSVDLEQLRRIGEAVGIDWAEAAARANDLQDPHYRLVQLIDDITGNVNHDLQEMRLQAVAETEVEQRLARIVDGDAGTEATQ